MLSIIKDAVFSSLKSFFAFASRLKQILCKHPPQLISFVFTVQPGDAAYRNLDFPLQAQFFVNKLRT